MIAKYSGLKEVFWWDKDAITRDSMMSGLKKDIAKRQKEMDEGKVRKYKTVIKKKRYTDLFKTTPLENGGYSYELDNKAIDDYSRNYRGGCPTPPIRIYVAMKITDKFIDNEIGKKLYSHRGNMCELPNGSIKYNLNGKELYDYGAIFNDLQFLEG